MRQFLLAAAAAVAALAGSPAAAERFELRYAGFLYGIDQLTPAGGGPNALTGETPFTIRAVFDDTSPNLVAVIGVPEFVAYTPLSARLSVLGTTYDIKTFAAGSDGIGVAIFGKGTPFGNPAHYGVGFIADPLADGAGIIGDFVSASPEFSATNLVPTVWQEFEGAGYLAGPGCLPFLPPPCRPTSWKLTTPGGDAFELLLATRDEEVALGRAAHIAQLLQVPTSATLGLFGLGAMVLAAVRRRS
jgi:hypothetical protein